MILSELNGIASLKENLPLVWILLKYDNLNIPINENEDEEIIEKDNEENKKEKNKKIINWIKTRLMKRLIK